MSALLERIDIDNLLQHMPPNVRTSIETLERAGTDWNTLGNLMAVSPTSGVATSGTGQWTSDLWEAVKWEFRSFLCTESDRYAELRSEWSALAQRSPAHAVGSLASAIGATLGVTGGVIAPLLTLLFLTARRLGEEDLCSSLAASTNVGVVQPRAPCA